jgi:hypothetical protein
VSIFTSNNKPSTPQRRWASCYFKLPVPSQSSKDQRSESAFSRSPRSPPRAASPPATPRSSTSSALAVEAFAGHPLADRGLTPYGVFEIRESSWVRKLERMNAVHRYHDKHRFMRDKKHFVFSFHDTTFECVAESFTVEVSTGSVNGAIRRMLEAAG